MSGTRALPLVVDASVVLKWQLDDEEDVDRALALRDDYLVHHSVALHAPTLLLYELANGLRMASRRARLSEDVEQQAMANLVACRIELHPPDAEDVLATARRLDLTAYDASYAALAVEIGAALWTGDRRLHRALADHQPAAGWIGDYTARE